MRILRKKEMIDITHCGMKNAFSVDLSRLVLAEGRLSEFEDVSIECPKTPKANKPEIGKKIEQKILEGQNNNKTFNKRIIGVPEGEEKGMENS